MCKKIFLSKNIYKVRIHIYAIHIEHMVQKYVWY